MYLLESELKNLVMLTILHPSDWTRIHSTEMKQIHLTLDLLLIHFEHL